FDARKARTRALDAGFRDEQIVRYAVRPFDTRWCYYTDARPIWNEPRPALWAQRFDSNHFIATRPAGVANPEGIPFMFTAALGDNDALRGHAYYFPLGLNQSRPEAANGHLFGADDSTLHNYSPTVAGYLEALGETAAQSSAADIWLHTLAIGYSPAYLEENADGIRQNWPRIPLPSSQEQFRASAALGQRVADLLDTEKPVAGVTAGALRQELRSVAGLRRMDGKPLHAEEDLQLTAGWGHAGKEGVTMPGRGKLLSRERTAKELAELTHGLAALGIPQDEGLKRLGSTVVDVYLNDFCAWTNVPEQVWEVYIGGYQVMKKWLSYREYSFLKRPLTLAEAEEVQAMARRLTALCLLQPELDANYQKVKSATWHVQSDLHSIGDAARTGLAGI
ncbi:MAG TPA: type ISP restriction/modification enzyme, partial [Terracidiphilus sp.]|nr:type ISP restriction/modification enzyme [Terracidiphilus sp.]